MGDAIQAEVVDETFVEEESRALMAVERAQVDVQVTTAKQYPRSMTTFKRQALAMATVDESTAAACFYSVERGGKKIEGPSVRLAEIVGSCWGNMRCEVLPAAESERSITMVALAWDLETNFAQRIPVSRRITNKRGERFNEDMINVTKMAAASIARRNAIFAVVPRALVSDVYDEVKKAAAGKGLTMEQRRERVVKEYAEKFSATEKQVLLLVRRKGRDDVSLDDIIHLKGLSTAISDGETTLAQAVMEATGVVETDTLKQPVTPAKVATAPVEAADEEKGQPVQPKVEPTKEPAKVPEVVAPAAAPAEAKTAADQARELFK